MCQGKLLKAAALRSLSMCADGTTRKHLQGFCHQWKIVLGSITCVQCSCGAASIWASGEELRAPSSWLTRWTVMTEEDTKSLHNKVCIGVLLPLPRSMTISKNLVAVQRQQLAQLLRAVLNAALDLGESTARVDEEVGRFLGLPYPDLPDAMANE